MPIPKELHMKLRPGGTRDLGPRYKEVAQLVSQGLSNKEIAYQLHLTYGTVTQYLYYIFAQMGIHNRTELAAKWLGENPL